MPGHAARTEHAARQAQACPEPVRSGVVCNAFAATGRRRGPMTWLARSAAMGERPPSAAARWPRWAPHASSSSRGECACSSPVRATAVDPARASGGVPVRGCRVFKQSGRSAKPYAIMEDYASMTRFRPSGCMATSRPVAVSIGCAPRTAEACHCSRIAPSAATRWCAQGHSDQGPSWPGSETAHANSICVSPRYSTSCSR